MSEYFPDNALKSWETLAKAARSAKHIERKEALSQARVRALDYLEENGIPTSDGKAQRAIIAAVEKGLVDPALLPQALRAIKVRNWLIYHNRVQIESDEVAEAVEALRRICGDRADEATPSEAGDILARELFEQMVVGGRLLEKFAKTALGVAAGAVAAGAALDVFDRLVSSLPAPRRGPDWTLVGLAAIVGIMVVYAVATRSRDAEGTKRVGETDAGAGYANSASPGPATMPSSGVDARPLECRFLRVECLEHFDFRWDPRCGRTGSVVASLRNRCRSAIKVELCFARPQTEPDCFVREMGPGAVEKFSVPGCRSCGAGNYEGVSLQAPPDCMVAMDRDLRAATKCQP